MRIINNLFRAFSKKKETTQSASIIPSTYTGQGQLGVHPTKTYSELVSAYNGWVYTTIDKIAKTVAMLPLKLYVYRKDGKKIKLPTNHKIMIQTFNKKIDQTDYLKSVGIEKEEITDHAFLDLIYHPNNIDTRFNFWYNIMIRMELAGACGIYMVKNGLGLPQEMWTLPLTKYGELRPIADKKIVISGYNYVDGDIIQKFTPEEILYLRYPNPSSPYEGMSPLMAQTYPYDIDFFLGQQQVALFKNRGVPGITLGTDQQLSQDQVGELKQLLDEGYAGAVKAGKPLVLHSGLKGDKSLTQTGRDFMIAEVAKYAKDKLISAYDVSPAKITGDAVNRSVMEVLDESYMLECIKPKAMMIEETFEMFVLPLYDVGLTLDFELPEHRDRAADIAERDSNLKNFVTTINEERAKDGMAEIPWGHEPWMPLMVTQPGGTVNQDNPDKSATINNKKVSVSTNDKIWKSFATRTETWERRILPVIRKYWDDQLETILENLNREYKGIVGTYQGWSRKKVQQHISTKGIIEIININKTEEEVKLRKLMTPIISSIMEDAGEYRTDEINQALGLKSITKQLEFNVNDPAVNDWLGARMSLFSKEVTVNDWLGARMSLFSKEVTDTTFAEINAILREGFTEGQPLVVVSDTLRSKFASYDKYRAPLIARTETISSSNHADLAAVEQTGLKEELLKYWISSRDASTRETHLQAEVEYADGIHIDDDFIVGTDSMKSPGNGLQAAENIQCRCTVGYMKKES